MTKTELAGKSLKAVCDTSFECSLSASEGGACGNGWCGDEELFLEKEELLYLIKQRVGHPAAFKGMKTKKVDVESTLYDMAKEGS